MGVWSSTACPGCGKKNKKQRKCDNCNTVGCVDSLCIINKRAAGNVCGVCKKHNTKKDL